LPPARSSIMLFDAVITLPTAPLSTSKT